MGKIINLLLLANQLNDKIRFETLLRRTFPSWETRVIWVKDIKDFNAIKFIDNLSN